MKEAPVEKRLKQKLEPFGFEVLKLTTPGTSHVMDRMIRMPTWSPAPPAFVEVKRPGEEPRPAQDYTAQQWKRAGCDVREYVDTYEKVDALALALRTEAELRAPGIFLPWTRHNEEVA